MHSKEYPWHISYPGDVPHSVDIPDIPLYHFLDRAAESNPSNFATIFMGHRMTFGQLKEKTDRLATALHGLGVKKGDRVAIMLPNCPQAVLSYYAVLRLGAVAVMTNPLYTERELSHQLKDSGAETIIILDLFCEKALNVLPETSLKNIIATGIQEYLTFPLNLLYPLKAKRQGQKPGVPGGRGILPFKELLRNSPPTPPPVEIDPEKDLALLQYTGGTTGVSKGAMLTHKNLVANVLQLRAWLSDCRDGGERIMCVLPFFHVYGMTVCMNFSIYTGAVMILIPRFEIDTVLKQVNKYSPTLFPGVPSIYVAIISHPEIRKYNISSIRACISAAAPLPVEVQEKFEEITGGKLVEGYGLSETSPSTHCNPFYGERVNGSIGLPLPGTDAKIMDLETGSVEMPVGEVGELCVKGPQVMQGYWNMPEETAQALRGGWFYTGDMARMDEKGFFYIVDRKKDLVIAGGFNIYPREVEEVLYEHPKVKEAVVAGIPDSYRGETLKAYIVLREGEETSGEDIKDFCRKHLAPYKVPKQVEFRPELPKSLVGKILRRVLVEEERAKLEQKEVK